MLSSIPSGFGMVEHVHRFASERMWGMLYFFTRRSPSWFHRLEMMEMSPISGSKAARSGRSFSLSLASGATPHSLRSVPFGRFIIRRRTGFLVGLNDAPPGAGTPAWQSLPPMMSSSGRAMATPMPRRAVRRLMVHDPVRMCSPGCGRGGGRPGRLEVAERQAEADLLDQHAGIVAAGGPGAGGGEGRRAVDEADGATEGIGHQSHDHGLDDAFLPFLEVPLEIDGAIQLTAVGQGGRGIDPATLVVPHAPSAQRIVV